MENKRIGRKVSSYNKDYISCIKKIIKHQEELYNVFYKDGKWIRNVKKKKKKSNIN